MVSKPTIPPVLKPRDGTASDLQQKLDKDYTTYQNEIKEIDEYYSTVINKLFAPMTDGDTNLVNTRSFIDTVNDYVTQMNEATAQYYANSREAWAIASDIELPEYDTVYASAARGLYDALRGYSGTDYNGITWTQVKTGENRAGITITSMWSRALAEFDRTQPAQWLNLANDVAHRSARLTTLMTAEKDPSGVRYARVPQGVTCEWCVMIASNGFIYHTEDSAGDVKKYHPNDDCLIVPSWGKQSVPGYEPEVYYQQYKSCADTVSRITGRDDYRKWVESQPQGVRIPRYDVWKRNQILAEMRTRDRVWLNTGKIPSVKYENDAAREEVREHERKTIDVLQKAGFPQMVIERYKQTGVKTPDAIMGSSFVDWKTPTGNSKNSIDALMRKAHNQGSDICVIHLQKGVSHISVDDCIKTVQKEIKRRALESVLVIDYDDNIIRIRP